MCFGYLQVLIFLNFWLFLIVNFLPIWIPPELVVHLVGFGLWDYPHGVRAAHFYFKGYSQSFVTSFLHGDGCSWLLDLKFLFTSSTGLLRYGPLYVSFVLITPVYVISLVSVLILVLVLYLLGYQMLGITFCNLIPFLHWI